MKPVDILRDELRYDVRILECGKRIMSGIGLCVFNRSITDVCS